MSYILIALRYLPLILEAVKAVEAVIGAGKGKEKKALVMACIEAASETGEKSDDKAVSVVSTLVDKTVETLNATGVFRKPEAASAQ